MKQAQLLTLAPGTTFFYRDREATVLEHTNGGVFVQMNDFALGRFLFGKSNNWAASSLREYLNNEGAKMLTDGNLEELLDTVTDLTALDGGTEYGNCTDKVTLLTLDQCRKYRYIRPLPIDGWEWTSTPDCTPSGWDKDAELVVCLDADGNISGSYCTDAYGARPAFTLPSNLTVQVAGDGGLTGYTDEELLTELLKRRQTS